MKNFWKKYWKSFQRFFLIVLFILFQVYCMIFLTRFLKNYALLIYVSIEIISVMILIPLIADSRNAAYKMLWMSVILILPIVGHLMYNLWGKEKAHEKNHRKIQMCINRANSFQKKNYAFIKQLKLEHPSKGKISHYLYKQDYPPYTNTKIDYFELGEKAFSDMIRELQRAERFVLLSFFTIADGVIWSSICEVLREKIKQGVEVKILYDDAGSVFQISDKTIQSLQEEGMEIVRFNSVEKNFQGLFLNFRNHQKIIVVDGKIGYTGGINASDRYANIDSPYGHWKDIAVKLTGDAVWSMTLIFLGMWEASEREVDYEKYRCYEIFEEGYLCQPFADGPSNNPVNQAVDMYLHMIQEANEEVYITTPYLIIDDTMINALCLAAKSGIDVRIITPGIPDKKMAKLLTEWHYGRLLEAGVRIFEYLPGFIHAKLCINEFSGIVGTINMDFRSFFLHFETGVWTCEEDVVKDFRKDIMDTLKECKEVTYEEWKERPVRKKVIQGVLQVFKCEF